MSLKPMSLTVLCIAAALLGTGCVTPQKAPQPDRHEQANEPIREQKIAMPQGVDRGAAELIEQGRRFSIYVDLLGIDDPRDKKLFVRPDVVAKLGITNAQMRRRLMDTVMASRRFEVYDISSSVTADKTDYVVDALVTQVTQELVRIEGNVRVSRTRVELSLQGKQRYEGTPMFAGSVVVVGQTGSMTGDRATIMPTESLDSPDVQERLAVDYERALRRALDEASKVLADKVRPMGKIVSADGEQFGMLGGLVHGFQGKDEVVVFRATTIRLPVPPGAPQGERPREEFSSTRPIAVARCDGVGTRTSQCVLIRRAQNMSLQVGDYVVLSDYSARNTRLD